MQAKARAGEPEFVAADFVKKARSIAEDGRYTGNGIPDDIAKAPQAGEGRRDFVPVGMKGEIFGSADGDEALCIRNNGAGVDRIHRKRGTGGKRLRERNGSLVKLTRPVSIRVERGDGKRDVATVDANLLPVERRGDLQGDAGERGFSVVAHGDEGADRDLMSGGMQMHVKVEG